MQVQIERVTTVDAELVAAFARLVPQLSQAPPPGAAELAEVVRSGTLLIARDAAGIVMGTLTLTLYRIPTSLQARIDDLVVDDAARGRGVGEALGREAIAIARAAGAKAVSLSSHPRRAAANRLYLRLGFELRETNSYLYKLL